MVHENKRESHDSEQRRQYFRQKSVIILHHLESLDQHDWYSKWNETCWFRRIFTYKRAQNTHSCQSTLVLFGVFKQLFGRDAAKERRQHIKKKLNLNLTNKFKICPIKCSLEWKCYVNKSWL